MEGMMNDGEIDERRRLSQFELSPIIQATDKTFAETREKAQKLAEEEKKKATK
uniref:Uncharacterized protein n=1 Tax=Plectus sambesii TaxID=2011161 RepID=A0A914VQ08_9BILA